MPRRSSAMPAPYLADRVWRTSPFCGELLSCHGTGVYPRAADEGPAAAPVYDNRVRPPARRSSHAVSRAPWSKRPRLAARARKHAVSFSRRWISDESTASAVPSPPRRRAGVADRLSPPASPRAVSVACVLILRAGGVLPRRRELRWPRARGAPAITGAPSARRRARRRGRARPPSGRLTQGVGGPMRAACVDVLEGGRWPGRRETSISRHMGARRVLRSLVRPLRKGAIAAPCPRRR